MYDFSWPNFNTMKKEIFGFNYLLSRAFQK